MPAAEFEVDETLVRTLLGEQCPDVADLPITELAHGWDNVMFRLGDELTVRLPRRRVAAELVEHEQRCLPQLPPLPIPTPRPHFCGRPTADYPVAWSVLPWFPGVTATDASFTDPAQEARRLGEFLHALHQPAPDDAPHNPFRGHDIRKNESRVMEYLDQIDLTGLPTADMIAERWWDHSTMARYDGPPVWLHGDLHAANVVVDDGAISAVVDFGDITSGDPACDLAIAWMLFERPARRQLRLAAPHVDGAMWARAKAWALHFALVYLANSADNPRQHQIGERLIVAVVED